MNTAVASLPESKDFTFESEDGSTPPPLSALAQRALHIWIGMSWRAQTLALALTMTATSFGLSMLVAYLGRL